MRAKMPRRRKAGKRVVGARLQPLPQDSGTKAAILEAALECFARYGFEGTTMSEVARSAGVVQPLMHYYFRSKDELWQTAVASVFDTMLDQLNEELQELDPLAELRVLIRRFIRHSARHRAVAPLVLNESHRMSPRLKWLADTYIGPLEKHMTQILARAQAQGHIKALPAPYVVRVIVAAAGVFFSSEALLKHVHGIDIDAPGAIETHTDVIFAMLFKGLEIPAASRKIVPATNHARSRAPRLPVRISR